MGIIAKQKYAQEKIDKLLDYLRTYRDKGKPIEFEVLIDGFKAVRRTDDPEMFNMFESFVNADSRALEILFYTGSSNNNDKHIFIFQEEVREPQGLSGLEIDHRIQEGIEREKRNWEFESLKKENEALKEEIGDLEQELERLETERSSLASSQSPLKGILGEIGSSFVEGLIRRNPKLIAKIPGGETLAGLIEDDNREREQALPEQDLEVTFVPKKETPSSGHKPEEVLNEEDLQAISFVNQLKATFVKEEFDLVMEIIERFAADRDSIREVHEYLKHQENA